MPAYSLPAYPPDRAPRTRSLVIVIIVKIVIIVIVIIVKIVIIIFVIIKIVVVIKLFLFLFFVTLLGAFRRGTPSTVIAMQATAFTRNPSYHAVVSLNDRNTAFDYAHIGSVNQTTKRTATPNKTNIFGIL